MFSFLKLLLLSVAYTYATRSKPNIIIFFADDLGYGDLAAYGNANQESGPIETMAREGMKFTQWTSAGFMCTPSRAALLTGRYPKRTGVYGENVFSPTATGGLPRSEYTIAEMLKAQGYATGMVGKWHLGINRLTRTDGYHLPHNHGFDYVGTNLPFTHSRTCESPTSSSSASNQQQSLPVRGGNRLRNRENNNVPVGPRRARNQNNAGASGQRGRRSNGRNTNIGSGRQTSVSNGSSCFVYQGDVIVEQPTNTNTLSERLLNDAKSFILSKKNQPFFLYYSFPHVHQSWFCNEKFCGKSKRGLYGDNINEMAWSVGEVLSELKTLGIANDTLVIFTSDHGGPEENCRTQNGPSNGGLRGGKGTYWEGGMRVPAIAWWPGTITPNKVSNSLVSHLDIFPTAFQLAGGDLSALTKTGNVLDGSPIPEIVWSVKKPDSFRYSMFYYCSDRLMAVRYFHYKIYYVTMGKFEKESGCRTSRNDYNCHNGKDLIEHDPPIVVDLNKSSDETVAEDNLKKNTKDIITIAKWLVDEHQKTFKSTVPSQIELPTDKDLKPCCNPPTCSC